MKTPIYLLIIVSLILGSCSSSYKAGVAEYDDLYYTPKDAKMQAQVQTENVQPTANQQNVQAVPQEELSDYERYRVALEDDYVNEDAQASLETAALTQEDTMYIGQQDDMQYAYYDDGSAAPVVQNYYGTVNQYPDYSARINRFNSGYGGSGYYDPYYSDAYYDPYNSWGSRFSVNIGLGFGMGYGYGGYGGYGYGGYGYSGYGYGNYYGYGPGYGWGSHMSSSTVYADYTHNEGTLIINIFDTKQELLIYEAVVIKNVGGDYKSDKRIRELIARSMMYNFQVPVAGKKK